jgi:ergothioneine biosynthesis protein EgtB
MVNIPSSANLLNHYQQVRQASDRICQPLATEDYIIQSMPDVSPPKWHLAHTTWFFETFLLVPHLPGYKVFHPQFGYLFNSYYEAIGARHPRADRGLLSRPTVAEVDQYREYVDTAMVKLIGSILTYPELEAAIVLGLHHEQQHQELLLTDIKHILGTNPLHPIYRVSKIDRTRLNLIEYVPNKWLEYPGGLVSIGHQSDTFGFDNESPRHQVYLQEYRLADRLVTNGEYLEFVQAGGYQQAQYWLAEGWMTVQSQQWRSPLYWEQIDGQWWVMTLGGLCQIDEHEPVCHISFYEADAYASWRGYRLPTEAEWEVAAAQVPQTGNFVERDLLHPAPSNNSYQFFGDVWEWTQSAYLPYPGFRVADGAIGEYNGKFMCNQMVLRGGSCVTPQDHIRSTYRNFFPTSTRWQFTGIRLAS